MDGSRNERLSEPPLVALSRFTVPLLPGGHFRAWTKIEHMPDKLFVDDREGPLPEFGDWKKQVRILPNEGLITMHAHVTEKLREDVEWSSYLDFVEQLMADRGIVI
jgi:hypothetical protein